MPKKTPKVKTSSSIGTGGYAFANSTNVPDDYTGFSKQDVQADSSVKAAKHLEPFPKSRKPEVLELATVLGQNTVDMITKSGKLVFHTVGDTGGVKEPSKQFAVADAMAEDLAGKTYEGGRPAFFYHLGDVVYYLGQERYYYDQFYDPYRNYDAPIFAIPGNHDGMISPSLKQKTLAGFLENFCTVQPTKNAEAQQFARTTMTQPGVYFTLDLMPFAKIVGLYSNTSEGGSQGVISGKVAGTAQLTFLQQQLQAAADARKNGSKFALIVAVHHPAFTGSEDHMPSSNLLRDLDRACDQAKILPDIVFSGHAHLYERYTRNKGGNQIPFLVAGMGGYFNLSGLKPHKGTKTPPPKPKSGVVDQDYEGNKVTLESYDDVTFGFLRVTLSSGTLNCEFIRVDPEKRTITTGDSFTLDLDNHTVTTI